MAPDTRVSIVIPTRDNIPFLANAVESALQTTTTDDEIIIVGNGSDAERAVTEGYARGVATSAEARGKARVVYLESRTPGYTPSVNLGLRTATGKFLVITNDDVIFAPNWLDEMLKALVRATLKAPDIKWGFVGPHTNCGLPVQTLSQQAFPAAHNPALREKIVAILEKSKHPEIIPTGALSGFCLMITREAYEAVGDLDEEYPGGGFTDNDWQLRGQERGFLGLLAPRSFVYHIGHVSMDKYTPGHRGGVENLQLHMRKWYRPRTRFLTIAYRVQINTEKDLSLFLRSLHKSKELTDACVILDDRSEIELLPVFEREGLRDWVKAYTKNPKDLPFDEVRDRDNVIELARATKPDWIINLDHDEEFDERMTRADMDHLMNPVDPAIKCYVFPIFTFWRGTTHVRLDSVWGTMTLSTMFKNEPCWGGIYKMTENTTFHCRRVPTYIPTDVLSPTKRIVVKHYGYYEYEKSVEKRKYYCARDQDKVKNLIGTENYEHLEDETQLSLLPYSSSKLTVVMLAKNESFDLSRQLRFWSHYADELLIIDTGSTDGGPDFARSMGAKVIPYRCCAEAEDKDHLICDFSAARNFAIEQATGDFILFLDPDEEFDNYSAAVLPKVLLQQADAYMIEIHNFTPTEQGTKPYITRQPRLFRRDERIRYSDPIHETLAKALKAHPELEMTMTNLVVKHLGFLKVTGDERKAKNQKYAARLVDWLENNPDDASAIYALAGHLISIGKVDNGDVLLERALNIEPNLFDVRLELACRLVQRAVECLLDAPKESIEKHPELHQVALQLVHVNRGFCKDLRVKIPN